MARLRRYQFDNFNIPHESVLQVGYSKDGGITWTVFGRFPTDKYLQGTCGNPTGAVMVPSGEVWEEPMDEQPASFEGDGFDCYCQVYQSWDFPVSFGENFKIGYSLNGGTDWTELQIDGEAPVFDPVPRYETQHVRVNLSLNPNPAE